MSSHLRDDRPLVVGVLELGPVAGGIARNGRSLAAGLRGIENIQVLEHATDLSIGGLAGILRALSAVKALRRTDVVVVPYSRYGLWASGHSRLLQIVLVHLGLGRYTIADLHDVYETGSPRRLEWWVALANGVCSGAIVFHGDHEVSRVNAMPFRRRSRFIPLPVETRLSPSRTEIRRQFGLTDEKILVMLGWIHQRKNCEVAIEALSLLPGDTRLWLIGEPRDPGYGESLRNLATRLGVSRRLEITGYLPESELDRRLAAANLGLCPYLGASASASLSTLLGARVPVIASDLPLTRELQALAPGAVTIVPATADSFASAISAKLAEDIGPAAFDRALKERSPGTIARDYGSLLAEVAQSRLP